MALAIDHRAQLEKIADDAGAPRERIGRFKRLAVEAAAQVAAGRPGFGMLLDGRYGREALFRAGDHVSGSAARSSSPARGRSISNSAARSAPSSRNGRSATRSSACASTIPTTRTS